MTYREELKKKVVEGLFIREKLIAEPSLELCQQLMTIAEEVKTIGLILKHDHGLLLGEELAIRSAFHKMIIEEDTEMADRIFNRIVVAFKKATYLGDQDLALRLQQTRADYYELTGDILMEIETIERSNMIQRNHNRTMRLIRLYGEYISMLNRIIPKEEEEKMIADKTMEANYKCYCELQILRKEKGFDYKEYVKKNHMIAFRVYIYIGVMLSNPFVNEIDSNEQKIAKESFELAIEVATFCGNTEYLCAAWGQKVGAYYGRADGKEREDWVKYLKFLKDKYKPQEKWIDETLEDIEKSQNVRLANSETGVQEPLDQAK